LGSAGAVPLWEGAVADPVKTNSLPMCVLSRQIWCITTVIDVLVYDNCDHVTLGWSMIIYLFLFIMKFVLKVQYIKKNYSVKIQ